MEKKMNLFCLHFAGGNKHSYRDFVAHAPAFLKVIPLEAPGRGMRMHETLLTEIHAMVDDFYQQVKNKIDEKPFGIYGHSMGGLVAYLLAKKIEASGNSMPVHLFITGTSGPSSLARLNKQRHLMNKEDFLNEIKELGGMPDEILQHAELLNIIEPILRSDFQVSENYVHNKTSPLNIPLTVITGTEEDMEMEDIKLWQQESTAVVDFKRLPGNHFFIYNYAQEIIEVISRKLYNHTKALQYE